MSSPCISILMLNDVDISSFWSLSTWLLAIGGSLIVLVIWGLLTRKRA